MRNHKYNGQSQQGSVMILVLIVMMMLVVLSLTLFSATSFAMCSTERRIRKEQSRILAMSISRTLNHEILRYEYETLSWTDAAGRVMDLKEKLRTAGTDAWPEGEICLYDLEPCGLPGETILELFWIKEEEKLCLNVRVTTEIEDVSATITCCYYPENEGWEESQEEKVNDGDGVRSEEESSEEMISDEEETAAWKWHFGGLR